MKRQELLFRARPIDPVLVLALQILLVGCGADGVTPAAQTPAERGRVIVAEKGCTACHALDDTRGVGPGWAGLHGSTRTLKGGGSVVVDEAYLRRAIREPAVDVVAGFDNVMIPAAATDAELADIIALIKELGDATAP